MDMAGWRTVKRKKIRARLSQALTVIVSMVLITGMFVPVGASAAETETATGGESATVECMQDLIDAYGTVNPDDSNTMIIDIPEGETVYAGSQFDVGYIYRNGDFVTPYKKYILTGGGTLCWTPESDSDVYNIKNTGTTYQPAAGFWIEHGFTLQIDNMVLDGGDTQRDGSFIRDYGDFIMNGGTIEHVKKATTQNLTNTINAVVSVYCQIVDLLHDSTANFTMNGGTIQDNDMDYVVRLEGTQDATHSQYSRWANFTMNGGTIQDNQSVYGTVTNYTEGAFTMNAGKIIDNSSTFGGAVTGGYVLGKDNYTTLEGGLISGNTATSAGNGIYFLSGKSLTIGGDIQCDDGIQFGSSDPDNAYLKVTSSLENTIHVQYTATASYLYDGRAVAKGTGGYTVSGSDLKKIVVDNDGYNLCINPDTDGVISAELAIKTFLIKFNIDGKISQQIKAYCSRPSYAGSTDKATDEDYVYTFAGWQDSEGNFYSGLLPLARAPETYTAVYTKVSFKDTFISCVDQIDPYPLAYSKLTGTQLAAADSAYALVSANAKANDTDVVAAYQRLTSYHRVWDLLEQIDALPDVITMLQRTVIWNARSAYDSLTADERAMVATEGNFSVNYAILTNAEAAYQALARVQTVYTAKDSYTVYVDGDGLNLGAYTTGDGKSLVYQSSDPSVVAVDSSGNVTALKGGTAKVTVYAQETIKFSQSDPVTVTVVAEKATQTIHCNAQYSDNSFKLSASTSGDGKITYQSMDTSIATISSTGEVKTVGVGTVKIRVLASETDKYKSTYKEYTIDVQAAEGATYTVGNIKYKVTDASSGGDGTVSVAGMKSATATVTINKTVQIGNHSYQVTALSPSAFKNNKTMKSIKINAAIRTIGSQAFYGDSALKSIVLTSTKLTGVGTNALKGISGTAVIDVPNQKVTSYKKLFQGKGQGKNVTVR